jgi:peptide/nickel transport system permease protein
MAFVSVRHADIILCFPPILLGLLAVPIMGAGVTTLIVMLFILYTPGFIRVTHDEVLSARNQAYVTAVRALDASTPRILWRTGSAQYRQSTAGAALAHGHSGRRR